MATNLWVACKWLIPPSIHIPITQNFEREYVDLLRQVIFCDRVDFPSMFEDISVAKQFVHLPKSQLRNFKGEIERSEPVNLTSATFSTI